jgi:hypothetical protein
MGRVTRIASFVNTDGFSNAISTNLHQETGLTRSGHGQCPIEGKADYQHQIGKKGYDVFHSVWLTATISSVFVLEQTATWF